MRGRLNELAKSIKKKIFGPFKRKPQTQLSENPEEAKKKKEQNLIFDALGMLSDAINMIQP